MCPAVLRRVPDEDPEALRYLAALRLVPGAEVMVVERAPFNGPVRLSVNGEEEVIGAELSRTLQVEAARPARKRQGGKASRTAGASDA